MTGKLPDGWEDALPRYTPQDSAVATRKLSEAVINKLSEAIPELIGGSADLTGSNNTRWKNAVDFQPVYCAHVFFIMHALALTTMQNHTAIH